MKVEINDGRDVEGQRLGKQEASNDRDAERTARLAANSTAESDGSAPRSAAIVVIMIGRKRCRQPW